VREWVRNIYLLLTNQFLDLKMSKASNNMTPHRGDNEIVTQLRIMNQQMDQMANEFGGRLDRMERQHVKRVVR
jgi:hypothetical protein